MILAIAIDIENAEYDTEADIVFFDTKGILHRLHFTRGETKPTHTSCEIAVKDIDKLLKSGQRFQATKQTISIG